MTQVSARTPCKVAVPQFNSALANSHAVCPGGSDGGLPAVLVANARGGRAVFPCDRAYARMAAPMHRITPKMRAGNPRSTDKNRKARPGSHSRITKGPGCTRKACDPLGLDQERGRSNARWNASTLPM